MERCAINLAAPIEEGFGYGICGTHLAIELSRLADTNITCFTAEANIQRPVELNWLAPRIRATATACDPNRPTIYVQDVGDRPPGRPVVMYTCLDTERPSSTRRACYDQMDVIVGMSEWNCEVLRDAGFERCHAVPQGIDPAIFHPIDTPRRVFTDDYLFFSGGKLEYRKGQDVVLAAWRRFHQTHPDSKLVAAWYNAWPKTMQTLARSPYIDWVDIAGWDDVPRLLAANGIDPASVILQPPMPNWAMSRVYHQCDCGLFPTRAEPATNLPMMEMMACGKPVIATACAGQVDVLRHDVNAKCLTSLDRERAGFTDEDLGQWWSPSVDELVEQMTWAYENREAAASLGATAAVDMACGFTWTHTAERLLEVVERELGVREAATVSA